MPPTEFGLWLKAQREALGLSQHALALLFDTTDTTISRWERGTHECAAPGAVRLAIETLQRRHAAQRTEITEPVGPLLDSPEVPDAGTQPTGQGNLPPTRPP